MVNEPNTAECIDELTALRLADGSASLDDVAGLHAHVDGCADCRRLLAALSLAAPAPASRPRYELRHCLGSGGFGAVFEAWDRELSRAVALKLLQQIDAQAESEIRREAQTIATLSHPNVVEVFDVGWMDDQLFVAMELLRGGSVRQWLLSNPDPNAIVAAFVDAGRGLAAAHDAGIVHGDFKADNVLRSHDGRIVVADFGLSRRAPEPTTSVDTGSFVESKSTGVAGTWSHLAPEVRAGARTTRSSDQFALGVALIEALEGRGARHVRVALDRMVDPDPALRFASLDDALAAIIRPPRRIAIAALAVTVGVGVAAVAAGADRKPTLDTCTTIALEGVEASAIDAAFAGLDADAAATVVGDARAAMERFASEWSKQQAAVCRESGRERELGLQCLIRSRTALVVQLDVLGESADRAHATLARGAAGLSALADAIRCLPADRTPSRLGDDAFEAAHARAEAQLQIGDHQAAAATLAALRLEAVERGWTAAQGRAQLLEGSVKMTAGDPTGARASYVAAAVAGEAVDYDVLVVEGYGRAVNAAVQLGDLDDARRLARFAEAYAGRREPVPRAASRLAAMQARLATAAGNSGEAVAALERALSSSDRDRRRAKLQVEMASALLRDGRPDEAREHAMAALDALESSGPDALDQLPAFEVLARISGVKNDLAEADRWATALLDGLASVGLDRGLNFAIALNVRGAARTTAGRLAAARDDLSRALDLYESVAGPDSPTVGNGLYALGQLESAAGNHTLALQHLERAQGLARRSGNAHFEAAVKSERCVALRAVADGQAQPTCDAAYRELAALLPAEHPQVVEAAERAKAPLPQ